MFTVRLSVCVTVCVCPTSMAGRCAAQQARSCCGAQQFKRTSGEEEPSRCSAPGGVGGASAERHAMPPMSAYSTPLPVQPTRPAQAIAVARRERGAACRGAWIDVARRLLLGGFAAAASPPSAAVTPLAASVAGGCCGSGAIGAAGSELRAAGARAAASWACDDAQA